MKIEIIDIGRNQESCDSLERYWEYQKRRRELLIRRMIPWDTRKNHCEISALLERRLEDGFRKIADEYMRSTP